MIRHLCLGGILVAALLLRAWPVVQSPETYRGGLGMFGDSRLYHVLAYNLYRGNGFSGIDDGSAFVRRIPVPGAAYVPAIVRAPLYPAFLAGAYTVQGGRAATPAPDGWRATWDRVRLVQCVLDALVCLLVYLITRAIIPAPAWPALAAAALYASCPYPIFYARALLSESLATFLVASATLWTVLGLRRGTVRWWLLAGVGWGLVALCRPEYLLFGVVAAGLPFVANANGWRAAGKGAVAVLAGVALTVSPWVARNYAVFDRPVLTTGALGYALYLGTFETNTNWKGWNQYPDELFANARDAAEVRTLDRYLTVTFATGGIAAKSFDDRFLELALDRMRHDPWSVAKAWVIRMPRLWYQFYIEMYLEREASGYFALFYLALALFGFVRASREERRLMAPMGALCLYVTLVYLPLHIEPRYSVPCMPGLVSLCAIGLWQGWSWRRRPPARGAASVPAKPALRTLSAPSGVVIPHLSATK